MPFKVYRVVIQSPFGLSPFFQSPFELVHNKVINLYKVKTLYKVENNTKASLAKKAKHSTSDKSRSFYIFVFDKELFSTKPYQSMKRESLFHILEI